MTQLEALAYFCAVIFAVSVLCATILGLTAAIVYLRDKLRPPAPQRAVFDGLLLLDPDVVYLDLERARRRPKGTAA